MMKYMVCNDNIQRATTKPPRNLRQSPRIKRQTKRAYLTILDCVLDTRLVAQLAVLLDASGLVLEPTVHVVQSSLVLLPFQLQGLEFLLSIDDIRRQHLVAFVHLAETFRVLDLVAMETVVVVGAGQLLRHLVDEVDSELTVAEFNLQTLQKGRHGSDESNGTHSGDSLRRLNIQYNTITYNNPT